MFDMLAILTRLGLSTIRLVPPRRLALVLAGAALTLAPVTTALAGQPVSQVLNPAPPDVYSCISTGIGTICRAHTVDAYDLEPLGIVCGTGASAVELLDSGTHEVRALRFYDAEGNMTRRERVHRFTGLHVTNPLNGRTLDYQQHNTDWDVLSTPGDPSTTTFTGHGQMTITLPGHGVVFHEAGRVVFGPTGDLVAQAGPSDVSDYFGGDASVVGELCAALGA